MQAKIDSAAGTIWRYLNEHGEVTKLNFTTEGRSVRVCLREHQIAAAGRSGDRVIARRAFIAALAGGLLAAPLAATAQQAGKVWRIGYLSPAQGHNPIDKAFERSMKDLGYVESKNIRLERRYAAGRSEQLGIAAGELVRLNVDLIVVWSPAGTRAAKDATWTGGHSRRSSPVRSSESCQGPAWKMTGS